MKRLLKIAPNFLPHEILWQFTAKRIKCGEVVILRKGVAAYYGPLGGRIVMADRKPLLGKTPARPELDKLLQQASRVAITEEQLQEQRVSFAYGNAPEDSGITKDSVRKSSNSIRIFQT